jgi:hypothetical protein
MAMIRFALGGVGSRSSSAATALPIESRFVALRFVFPEDLPDFVKVLWNMFHPVAATTRILASGLPTVKRTSRPAAPSTDDER